MQGTLSSALVRLTRAVGADPALGGLRGPAEEEEEEGR
jgi:hypothetical protein